MLIFFIFGYKSLNKLLDLNSFSSLNYSEILIVVLLLFFVFVLKPTKNIEKRPFGLLLPVKAYVDLFLFFLFKD